MFAKEWKSLKIYQKETRLDALSSSDWLKSDRIHNTNIWQQVNAFNLENNLPNEYKNSVQRRDFYNWLYIEVEKHGHEVVWFKMVHYISKKLHSIESFPFTIFTNKKIIQYANRCSEVIFSKSFNEANNLFKSEFPLTKEHALAWDEAILYKEQYIWVDYIINGIDVKSERKIDRILQGKLFYSLLVPKEISFNGNLSNNEERFNYALNKLRAYCEKYYK